MSAQASERWSEPCWRSGLPARVGVQPWPQGVYVDKGVPRALQGKNLEEATRGSDLERTDAVMRRCHEAQVRTETR